MKTDKLLSLLLIIINVVGVICLIYFAIPYLTHDTTIPYPDAMLPAEAWDRAGMMLTIGLFPLMAANVAGYVFIKFKEKYVRLLFFVPGIICLAMAASYWIRAM